MRNLPESFEAILDRPYRWPKKGDQLLRKTGDWDRGAGFANDAISRHVHIWTGYMSAGEALVEDCRKNPQERQGLIYPILFMYRHAVELAMKWIITMYGRHSANDINHHDLLKLWHPCREIIDAAVQKGDGSTDIVERIIKELHDLDKSALAFRYGSDKNSKPPRLPGGLYDLENIRDVMTGVGHFFEGTNDFLSDLAGAAPY